MGRPAFLRATRQPGDPSLQGPVAFRPHLTMSLACSGNDIIEKTGYCHICQENCCQKMRNKYLTKSFRVFLRHMQWERRPTWWHVSSVFRPPRRAALPSGFIPENFRPPTYAKWISENAIRPTMDRLTGLFAVQIFLNKKPGFFQKPGFLFS